MNKQDLKKFKETLLNTGFIKIISKGFYYLIICYGLHVIGEIIWKEWNIYLTFTLFNSILFGVLFNILIHELGHLVAGLLGGYSFYLFSVKNIMWVKEDGKIKFSKRDSSAPLGQCLMISPIESNNSKFIFYQLGGIIANFLASSFALLLFYTNANIFVRIFSFSFAFIGISSCFTNAIPYGHSDGENIVKGLKNINYRRQIDSILRINIGMMQGESYLKLKKYVYLDEMQPLFSPNNVIMTCILVNAYNEEQEYSLAFKVIKRLWKVLDKLESNYQLEITKEYFFLLLLIFPESDEIKTIKNTEPYCSFSKMERADSKRIQATYVYLIKKEKEKALMLIDQAKNLINRMPTTSDKINEAIMINYIEKKIKES